MFFFAAEEENAQNMSSKLGLSPSGVEYSLINFLYFVLRDTIYQRVKSSSLLPFLLKQAKKRKKIHFDES